jgi:IS5 family transposase
LTPANTNDYSQLLPLVDRLQWVPDEVWADRGYDAKANHNGLAERGITAKISRRNRPGQGRRRDPLGRHRWPVERTNAWLNAFRRLLIRWDRKASHHQAFITLACCMVLLRTLMKT